MAEGSLKKICSCKDETGRRIGVGCPALRRPGGSWSPNHGRWAYQLELPPPPGSTGRRQLRRSGFATRDDAAAELRHAQGLLGLAGCDAILTAQIATMLTTVNAGQPLPEREAIARRVRAGGSPTAAFTVAEYLWQWYRTRKVQATTLYGYEGHIRNYLEPHLGHLPIDELRVGHIQAMFETIAERNIAHRGGPAR